MFNTHRHATCSTGINGCMCGGTDYIRLKWHCVTSTMVYTKQELSIVALQVTHRTNKHLSAVFVV